MDEDKIIKKAMQHAKQAMTTNLLLLKELGYLDQQGVKNLNNAIFEEVKAAKRRNNEAKPEPSIEEKEAKIDYTGVGGASNNSKTL